MGARLCSILLTVLVLGCSAAAAEARGPRPPRASHVVVIVLENRDYEQVVGNWEVPYLNWLARRGAVAGNYYGVTHPSLPNYLALIAGSTFGIQEDCTDCTVPGPNLATQMSRAGISWRAYMEGLPEPCFTGSGYGLYAKRHDPFAYFPTITSVPERCANIVPETRLAADLERHRLPEFAWLTPDVCHDGHDCPLTVVDYHLYTLVPQLMRQLGPHGLLIVTFDEGSYYEGNTNAGCCGGPGGGRIATILVGPDVERGKEILLPANHYSLLASLEDRFGLPRLGAALYAKPLAPKLFEPSE